MSSVIRIQQINAFDLPEQQGIEDVRSSDKLIELFVERFTQKGDNVFDPFLGYGTSVIVSEKMGRNGYGIECEIERVEFVRSMLREKQHIICGNSFDMETFSGFPQMDFSISSPPYMIEGVDSSYPFYTLPADNYYDDYLDKVGLVYRNLKKILKPGGYIVIEACNIIHGKSFNTLAWDIARTISKEYSFQKEYIIEWMGKYRNLNFGLNHSYCFLFQNK